MRFFKPNLIVATFASTVMIVLLAFYPIARGLDRMDGFNWVFFAVLMTFVLILHVLSVFQLAEKKN